MNSSVRSRIEQIAQALMALVAALHPSAFAAPTATTVQRDAGTVVDVYGRSVLTRDGTQTNYGPPAATAPVPVVQAAAALTSFAAAATAASDPAIGHRPRTSFASLGNCLGCTGLEIYNHSGRSEIIASTSRVVQVAPGTFPPEPNDFWYALTFNGTADAFDQVYVSERMPGGVARILMLQGDSGENDQLAVCGFDGSIRFYSAATKRLLQTLHFPIQNVFRCAIGDFAHTGQVNYLLASQYQAAVYDGTGAVLWTLPAPVLSYNDILVGQMDGGPALKIAVSQYSLPWVPADSVTIYDGATHQPTLHISSTALPSASLMAIASVGGVNRYALIVSEGWYAVDAFDPTTGTRLWQATTPINIGSLKVGNVLGGQTQQVLIGDGQWGSVHVIDAATGAPLFAIANPESGVNQMALGDLTGDGTTQLIWGADAFISGPQRFVVANLQTHSVIATSRDIDTFFTTPAIGHLTGDSSRQVVFASLTTDNGYDPGSIVVLDAQSGQTVAIQNVPLYQGWGNDYAVRVADVDGDGVDEIVVASTHLYAGAVDVYTLTSTQQVVLKSTTYKGFTPGAYPAFTALAVADADLPGKAYAAVGFIENNTSRGAIGPTVIGMDLATGAEKWRVALPAPASPFPGIFFSGPTPSDIQVIGRDASGAELLMVRRSPPGGLPPIPPFGLTGRIDVVRVDGTSATVVASYQGLASSAEVVAGSGAAPLILIGTFDGMAITLALQGSTLNVVAGRQVSSASIDSIHAGRLGDIWIVSAQRLQRVLQDGSIAWSSTDNGYSSPGLLATRADDGSLRLWVSSIWRVDEFALDD